MIVELGFFFFVEVQFGIKAIRIITMESIHHWKQTLMDSASKDEIVNVD